MSVDSLLYDRSTEDSIDFFKENLPQKKTLSSLPSFLSFGGPLLKKGKQGLVGFLEKKDDDDNEPEKYVYKISQYMDFMAEQEYNVMKDVNSVRDYCPHFVKGFGIVRLPITANYKKAKNPFKHDPDYKTVMADMIIMQHLEDCKKFFKYIKSDEVPTVELLSIVKQSLLASMIAHQKVDFTHYDMHSDNILIRECDPNSVFLYIVDDVYYMVPTYGRYPVLIDFGFSYSKSGEKAQMNCSLGHTQYGFIQCEKDPYTDAKLFLCSVSNEINKYKNSDTSQTFRNIVKNLYQKSKVQLDCGWDDSFESSINEDFLDDFQKTFEKSQFFDEQRDFIIDLLETLVILPLQYRKTSDKTRDLLALVINEFAKIEKEVADDFYNLSILKEMIVSANANRELYLSDYTREEAVSNFKKDILAAVDRVARYCNPKLNWERLLCTLFCLGKNIGNYCYEKMQTIRKEKTRNYKKIPLQKTGEIVEALEANIPSDFEFDKKTVIYTWNADRENCSKVCLDKGLIRLLNDTHPMDRGALYKDYMENPESYISERSSKESPKESSKRSERSKQSSKQSESSKESSKERSKERSKESSKQSERSKEISKESSKESSKQSERSKESSEESSKRHENSIKSNSKENSEEISTDNEEEDN
jgi:hypothetical protein